MSRDSTSTDTLTMSASDSAGLKVSQLCTRLRRDSHFRTRIANETMKLRRHSGLRRVFAFRASRQKTSWTMSSASDDDPKVLTAMLNTVGEKRFQVSA